MASPLLRPTLELSRMYSDAFYLQSRQVSDERCTSWTPKPRFFTAIDLKTSAYTHQRAISIMAELWSYPRLHGWEQVLVNLAPKGCCVSCIHMPFSVTCTYEDLNVERSHRAGHSTFRDSAIRPATSFKSTSAFVPFRVAALSLHRRTRPPLHDIAPFY